MMAALRRMAVGVLVVLASVGSARADVIAQTPLGFVSRNVVVMAGTPAAVWRKLVTPSGWWSSDHTFSGNAANLTLDPVPGGCFCEKLPAGDGSPPKPGTPVRARGGVEHMRVIFVDHAKAMRLVGGLGPLQSEAVSATLTITLTPVEGGTRIIFEYVVGGYIRYPPDKIAPAVDTVMANQLLSLAKQFGPVAAPPASAGPVEESAPQPADEGRGLDRKGLLLPRGRVWSLPANEPAPASAPVDAPTIAPLPVVPVPQDVTPEGGSAPAKKHAARKPAKAAPPPEPAEAGPPAAAPEASDQLAPKAPEEPKSAEKKSKAKPVKPPAVPATNDEPSKDTINSAFDAAFGGAPRPPQQ
jgi:hypothetical protein